MRLVPVLIAVVVVGSGVGCTSTMTTPPATSAAPGAITLPPRPRDIPLDGIDPCSLLTAEQRKALALDGEPGRYSHDGELLGKTRECTTLGFGTPSVSVGIALADQRGIERYTRGDLLADISAISVESFPAVLSRPRQLTDSCTVAIDIAAGELIDIQYGQVLTKLPQDQLCAGAERVADAIMRTLLAR